MHPFVVAMQSTRHCKSGWSACCQALERGIWAAASPPELPSLGELDSWDVILSCPPRDLFHVSNWDQRLRQLMRRP